MALVKPLALSGGAFAQASDTADDVRLRRVGVGADPTDRLSVKDHSAFAGSESNVRTGAVQTTDGTAAQVVTLTLADNTVYNIVAFVQARRTDTAGRSGFYRRTVVFREAAGAATLVGTVDTIGTDKTSGTITASVDITVSGNDVRVTVTGVVIQTINWSCTLAYQGVSGSA